MESEEIDLNNVCRTCKNESPDMKSLYHRDSESGQENSRLDEMLMACTTVQVNNEDDLPKIICQTCFVQLKNAYCFKEQCEKTDVFLRDYLKNRAVTKEKISSDKGEYISNVIVDNESTGNDTNNDKDVTENIRDDPESGYKNVDYVKVFRDFTIYQCRTCCKNFYTIEGLRNHKKVQHNVQLDVDDKMGGFSIQSDEVGGEGLDMDGGIIEPKVEVLENDDQDKIDEISQITNEIYTEEVPPHMFVEMGIIEDKTYKEYEEIEGETDIDAYNGNEYESEDSADSEYLPSGVPTQKINRGPARSRKYPIRNKSNPGKVLEHPARIHECDTCNKKFSRMITLRRHKLSHADVKPYLCVICKKCFVRRDHLLKHMKMHSTADTFNCDACEKVFNKEENLVRHKAYKHNIGKKVPVKEKKFKCEYCKKGFATEMNRDTHMQAHFAEKQIQCNVCEKTFTYKRYLKEHMKIHDGNSKKFLCTQCGKGFIRNEHLLLHMKRHRGEKPFKCKFCGKGFPRSTDLIVHERYHTGEKTHLCVICGKGFGRAYSLTVHMRTHTGEKPYRCTYCDAAFAQSYDMKAHVRRHTGERYQCELCPKSFLEGYLFTQHKRDVHGLNIVSNNRRLQQANKLNPDDPPPLVVPLPTPVVVASAIPSDALQIDESDMPELKQE